MNGRPVRNRKLSTSAERQIRERHVRRMKQRRRRRIIFRSFMLAAAVLLVMTIIIFLTPIFNVKHMNVVGNNRVSLEAIEHQLPDIMGENLFKVSRDGIIKRLSSISYILDVQVDKKYFPAGVTVVITEKQPCAVIGDEDGYKVLDSDCNVLEERSDKPADLPALTFYHESFSEFLKDSEAVDEFKKFFDIASGIDIFSGVTAIDILEYNEINFKYQEKIDVICGSGLDMDQKLRLFKAAVNNPGFTTNAHGTVDLSTSGKAMYNPD